MGLQKPVIAIVGAGAVGAFYGSKLARRGFDVHFLLRSDYTAVRERGWNIRSKDGDFVIASDAVKAYDDPKQMPKADLVIVTLKATSNDAVPSLVAPLIKDDTILLTMQNGLGNEELLADHFGGERVVGAMAFVCINRVAPGVVHHIDQGFVRVGEFIGGPTDRTRRIAEMFELSGIDCKVLDSLARGRWDKLIWNIPFNGLGAALDLDTQQLLSTPQGERAVRELMHEVISIAQAKGIEFPPDQAEKKIAITRPMGGYRTSMQVDRQERRSMEVEAIVGYPLKIAGELGVPAPRMKVIHELLTLVNDSLTGI
jgi:2-dehydropantoate 2-reductase